MESDFKISIIGAGRFGLFLGGHLARFYSTVFYDRDIHGLPGFEFRGVEECLKRDIVFLSIPVSELENFLIEHKDYIPAGTLLVDLCSVKLKPAELLEKYLPEGNKYLLTHPLFGPDSARETLRGHKIALTGGRLDPLSEKGLRELFRGKLGLEIVDFTPDEHDRLMAFNLSLMHHLGRTFDKLGIKDINLKMRSLSEIAKITEFVMNDSEQLFTDLYAYNPYSNGVREQFEETFKKITPKI